MTNENTAGCPSRFPRRVQFTFCVYSVHITRMHLESSYNVLSTSVPDTSMTSCDQQEKDEIQEALADAAMQHLIDGNFR